jgi:pyocin large subunit-like protein
MRRFKMIMMAGAALAVVGCDNGASAVETRDRAADAAAVQLASAPMATATQAAPEVKPAVTANRRETADSKIQRLYERNGAAFGARSADDYLKRIEDFTTRTPRDAETVKRPNGDTLIYQASTNTFAVVARDGTPRTMFKPDDGPAYWTQQKERAPTFGQRRQTE